jgi:hypothetical protein
VSFNISKVVTNPALLDMNPMNMHPMNKVSLSRHASLSNEDLAANSPMFKLNQHLANSQRDLQKSQSRANLASEEYNFRTRNSIVHA